MSSLAFKCFCICLEGLPITQWENCLSKSECKYGSTPKSSLVSPGGFPSSMITLLQFVYLHNMSLQILVDISVCHLEYRLPEKEPCIFIFVSLALSTVSGICKFSKKFSECVNE